MRYVLATTETILFAALSLIASILEFSYCSIIDMLKMRIEQAVDRDPSRLPEHERNRHGRPHVSRHDPNAVVTEIALYPTCK